MNKPFVSIIVPVYKVEKYLRQCIDSILNQTFSDFELIVVDDGSPDNCPKIIDEYSKKDERIIALHKKNGGQNSARKFGLSYSSGEYVLNVDGDDFIENNMLEHMVDLAKDNDADIVTVGYKADSEKSVEKLSNHAASGFYTAEKLDELKKTLFYSGVFYEGELIPALWNKLFRRKLLQKFQMSVPEDIRMGEDLAVSFPAVNSCSVLVIDNEFTPYHYRIVENSMSRSFDLKFYERTKILFDYLDSFFKNTAQENTLNYYKTFLLYWGANSLVASGSKFDIAKKIRYLHEGNSILNSSEIVSQLNSENFTKKEKKFVKALRKFKFTGYVLYSYFEKLRNRICR